MSLDHESFHISCTKNVFVPETKAEVLIHHYDDEKTIVIQLTIDDVKYIDGTERFELKPQRDIGFIGKETIFTVPPHPGSNPTFVEAPDHKSASIDVRYRTYERMNRPYGIVEIELFITDK